MRALPPPRRSYLPPSRPSPSPTMSRGRGHDSRMRRSLGLGVALFDVVSQREARGRECQYIRSISTKTRVFVYVYNFICDYIFVCT